MSAELSDHERERYGEQIERIGLDAQLRLKGARAIVVGARAAGSAAAAHLVSSGVGYVGVVDGGVVTAGDLFAQAVLYTPDVGSNRAQAVAAKLGVLNTDVHVDSYPVDVDRANAPAIVMGHDVVVDCGSDLPLDEPCRAAGVALVTASGPRAADGLQAAADALEALTAPAREGAPA